MSRPPKTHDNRQVHAFLDPYFRLRELLEDHPQIDDILSGLLAAKTEGDTSSRTLSRKTLFHILSGCPVIDTTSVQRVTLEPMPERTAQAYCLLARNASRFISRFLDGLPSDAPKGVTATCSKAPLGERRKAIGFLPGDGHQRQPVHGSLLVTVS